MPEDLEEIRQNVEEEKQSGLRNILKNISEKYFFAILVTILVSLYLVNQGYVTTQQVVMYIGIAIVAILFMSYRGFKENSYLTYEEAQALAEHFMKKMQRVRKIPSGSINVTPLGRLRQRGGFPDEFALHVKIRPYEGLIREFEVMVDPKKNGIGVTGVLETPTGFNPLRKPEVVFQATGEMFLNRQKKIYDETGKFDV